MNIILSYPDGNKILQDSTIEDGVAAATALSLTHYNVIPWTSTPIYVNDASGSGFVVSINESSTVSRILVFDTTAANVLSWVSTNFPTATVTTMGKNNFTLYSA
jgi:hypothetical protein